MVIKILLLLFLILSVAYFAGIETALLSLSTSGISRLKEKSKKLWAYLSVWESEPNKIITSILVGTNITMLAAGVIAGSIAVDTKQVFILPAVTVVVILIFGEIIPKVYSRYNPEKVTAVGIVALNQVAKIFSPLSNILVKISEVTMKFFGIYGMREAAFLTKEELKVLLKLDNELDLHISKPGRKMLKNILSFAERKIYEVMIPHSEIFAVDQAEELEEIVRKVISSKFSRVPVYKDSIDNIIGVIYSKDLIIAQRNKQLYVLEDIIRPVYFVPESASVDNLLKEFKSGRQHMAIVVDEYGSTVGLVTIEDLVEEIVGEIYDEFDITEKTIIELPEGSWLIRADESINKVNDELKLNLPTHKEFNTIAGWLLLVFGRIPVAGEKFQFKNIQIEVLEADRKRIKKVKLTKLEKAP
ncbi:MAG: hemolysin family protein [Elusimicrobiota bacterium]|nr:hemolysin family protein [Elusimicrobiota bacterium]